MACSFVLVLLALLAISTSADVFVSIDCGASDSYTDKNFIVWMGDDTLIQNGESKVVQSGNAVSDHVMSTLRVFSSRKKNCYSINANKGGQVLVRASFNYGNYDKKSSPPTFDLHFDGNYWATVETSSEDFVYYEAIYVVKGDVISVCVAQTQANQLPFISALEVRSLGSRMYSHVDSMYALFLGRRLACGANGTIRYSDDAYDRIWAPAVASNGLTAITSDAFVIDVSTVEDDPPQAVLQNAITTSTKSGSIILGTGFPTSEVPIYVTMYFSEVTQLSSTQKRSFEIYINNKSSSNPIIPPYGSVTELLVSNMTASSNTSLSLVATSDSTLPPLINAMEVFYVSDPLTDGTNSKDVEGLAALQNAFSILQEWAGDPCLPSPYIWDWINCSTDATPRVTALYLNGFDLTGPLPDFSSMDALETIDLHNNSLSESIPDFLGTLPNLKQLNLANNQFSGSIPSSLSKNNKLKLVISGNPNLCASGKSCQTTYSNTDTGGSSNNNSKSNLPVILGSIIPSFIVFWAIVGVLAILHHKRKTAAIAESGTGQGVGANRPNGRPQGVPVNTLGKIGKAVIHELKVNIEEQINTENSDQTDQQGTQDGRNA